MLSMSPENSRSLKGCLDGQMTKLMDGKDGISIKMPCAPMPVSAGEAAEFMHPRLVTYLTGYQPYYTRGGLIPHLTKKGFF